jgi:hypothetical protein
MSLSIIKIALFARLESLVFPAGVTVFYPNIGADLPAGNFIRPDVLPASTAPLDLVGSNQESGLLQVSIYVKKGLGELTSSGIAQTILDGFPRNLALNGVRIDRPGSIGPSFFDGNWQVTPVTIPYQNIA